MGRGANFARRVKSARIDIPGLDTNKDWPGEFPDSCRQRIRAHPSLSIHGDANHPFTAKARHS